MKTLMEKEIKPQRMNKDKKENRKRKSKEKLRGADF